MSRSYRWSIAVAAALAFAAPVSAQQVPTGDTGVAPITASMRAIAPVVSVAPVPAFGSAIAAETSTAPSTAPVPPAMRRSQSVALMIVGGAGMIVGSLIDGDTGTIIMVGGGVIGLVGLFQYLR
jgi:hypothetical protein